MATDERVLRHITCGPSKYDLIVLALAESKTVEFTFNNVGKRKVTITAVTRDSCKAGQWVIHGVILHRTKGYPLMAFESDYNTFARQGMARINETCLKCGTDEVETRTGHDDRCFTCEPDDSPFWQNICQECGNLDCTCDEHKQYVQQ